MFGLAVAYNRWSLTRGGRTWRFDCSYPEYEIKCFLKALAKEPKKVVAISISYFPALIIIIIKVNYSYHKNYPKIH